MNQRPLSWDENYKIVQIGRINNWAVVTVGVFHAQTLNHHLWSDVLSFRNLKYSSAFDIILLLRENFKSKIQKIWNERERKKADNGTQLFLVDRINDNIITEVRSVYSVGSRAEFFWKFWQFLQVQNSVSNIVSLGTFHDSLSWPSMNFCAWINQHAVVWDCCHPIEGQL